LLRQEKIIKIKIKDFSLYTGTSVARCILYQGFDGARERWPYPKAFVDRFGTYLFADDLARAIKNVVEEGFTGILHVCGEEY
jgi:hypothetical protein